MDLTAENLVVAARIEQQIADAKMLTIEVLDDEVLLRASEQLTELQRMLADVERKLMVSDRPN